MGDRGAANEPATDDDIDGDGGARRGGAARRRARLLDQPHTAAPRQGRRARARARRPTRSELLGIGEAIRRAGHGVFQFAPEHARLPIDEWPWMRRLAELTGQPVSVNLNQPDDAPEVWRDVLGLLDAARARRAAAVRAGRRPDDRHPLLPPRQRPSAAVPPGLRRGRRAADGRAARRARRPGATAADHRGRAGRRRAVREGRAAQPRPDVAGRRRRHRLRAGGRRLGRRHRGAHRRARRCRSSSTS